MKRFKIGFLATIAILAMSFTIASKTNTKAAKFDAPRAGCFTNVSLNISGTPLITDHQSTTGENVILLGPGQDNPYIQPVRFVSGEVTNYESVCTGENQFCCYLVAKTATNPDVWSIVAVYFKQ